MQLTEIIGTLAGIFTTIAVLPQIIKAIQSGMVKDVSAWTYVIISLGVSLWTIYGFLKMDWPIIITNGISVILNSIMLYIIFNPKNKKGL